MNTKIKSNARIFVFDKELEMYAFIIQDNSKSGSGPDLVVEYDEVFGKYTFRGDYARKRKSIKKRFEIIADLGKYKKEEIIPDYIMVAGGFQEKA